MPRKYIRKTDRRKNSPKDVLLQASHAVINGGVSIRSAAKEQTLNYQTLNRFVRKKKVGIDPDMGYQHSGSRVFTDEQEELLEAYIKEASEVFFGLTPREVRGLAWHTNVRCVTTSLYRTHGSRTRLLGWIGSDPSDRDGDCPFEYQKPQVWAERVVSTSGTWESFLRSSVR